MVLLLLLLIWKVLYAYANSNSVLTQLHCNG
jgi:hypothetical protein